MYGEEDRERLQRLNSDPHRKFAPPKMLARKLIYSPGKILLKTDRCEVALGLEHRTGTVVEIKRYQLRHLNQQLLDYVNSIVIFQTNLHHERIRKILDIQLTDSSVNVVTEYQPNGNLQQFCKVYSGISERITARFLRDIGESLSYCHSTQVAHFEILTQNISIGNGM